MNKTRVFPCEGSIHAAGFYLCVKAAFPQVELVEMRMNAAGGAEVELRLEPALELPVTDLLAVSALVTRQLAPDGDTGRTDRSGPGERP